MDASPARKMLIVSPTSPPPGQGKGQTPSPNVTDAAIRGPLPGILTSASHIKWGATTRSHRVRVPVVTFLDEEVATSLSPRGRYDRSPEAGSPRRDGFCNMCVSFDCRHVT